MKSIPIRKFLDLHFWGFLAKGGSCKLVLFKNVWAALLDIANCQGKLTKKKLK